MQSIGIAMPFRTRSALVSALMLELPSLGLRRYWAWRHRINDASLQSCSIEEHLSCLPSECHSGFRKIFSCTENEELADLYQQLCRTPDPHCAVIGYDEPAYPRLLKEIADPPPLLYVKGDTTALGFPQLAFVGSRGASRYGLELAAEISAVLAGGGIAITSGLARGIDASAHRGAIKAGGVTLAVMGTGVDRIYPLAHRRLAEEVVAQGGALISEFPPGTAPHRSNFPRRNRIISGLSIGVVVVEAAIRSGSLITARYALEQNREVFAVPGSIRNPLARGCHRLIREGAVLVESAADIVAQISHWIDPDLFGCGTDQAEDNPPDLSCDEDRRLWDVLDHEPRSVDALASVSSLPVESILSRLILWEMEGNVIREFDLYYRASC